MYNIWWRYCSAYEKPVKSRDLSRNLKLKIYKTIIRSAVTYDCKSWTLASGNEQILRVFEGKILRKVYGSIQCKDESWMIRINHKLYQLIKEANVVRFKKSQKLTWLSMVAKKIKYWKPTGRRMSGMRRKICVDLWMMIINGWRGLADGRVERRKVVVQVKIYSALWSKRKKFLVNEILWLEAKSGLHQDKIMLWCWWNSRWFVYHEFHKHYETMNPNSEYQQLIKMNETLYQKARFSKQRE